MFFLLKFCYGELGRSEDDSWWWFISRLWSFKQSVQVVKTHRANPWGDDSSSVFFHLRTELFFLVSPSSVAYSAVLKTLWELYDRLKGCPGLHTLLIKYLYNYQHLQWKMCTCISPQLMQVFLRSNLQKWSPRSVRLYLLNLACCHAYSDNANMLMLSRYNLYQVYNHNVVWQHANIY